VAGPPSAAADIAPSPNGNTLYVLKVLSAVDRLAVIAEATEVLTKLQPAPVHHVGTALSRDGGTLWEAVATPSVANVRAFSVRG
jgi:DNA-binding beta-propeller fold protein YncE